ncbi:MAG: 16S rRNA (guanine(527)-N(7))-methyltransferase RsmG [Micropruina sp.]
MAEARALAEDVFGGSFESVSHYVDILASRGVDWGLLGPREGDRLWERHILNSVALTSMIPTGSTVVDVGSGAGLPGVPLAILRPDLTVVLLEPLLRRANFLSLAVEELHLGDRVRVVRARAEDHAGGYDVVTCRAVAPLDRLVEWCTGLVRPGGDLLALKGSSAEDEVVAARSALRRRGLSAAVRTVRAHSAAEPTYVIRVR